MKITTLSILTVLALSAHAAPVQVGQPTYAGNGCPGGTATYSVSADGQNYILKPSQFAVHTGQDVGKVLDRQSCNVAIAIKAPAGTAVALVSRVSGFVAAESAGKVTINEELFFAGSQGQKLAKTYTNTERSALLDFVTSQNGVFSMWSQHHRSHQLEHGGSIASNGGCYRRHPFSSRYQKMQVI